MTSSDIIRYRLYNQQISHFKFTKPEDVVRWMGAVQAQDFPGALWSVGLRTPNVTVENVKQALADRKIVRTWPMRGTLHFIAPEDIRWMLELCTPRIIKGAVGRYAQLDIDEKVIRKSAELFEDALRGGKQLMRAEMLEVLEKGGVTTADQRGYHLLGHAAQTGLICFGPLQEKQQTFVLIDEWVPKTRQFNREEALRELIMRYFTSHGPATLHDFAWWAGLKVSDVRAGLGAVSQDLRQEVVDGKTYWMSKDLPELNHTPSAYLLPGFDEYMLGYTDRSHGLEKLHANKIVPGNNGMFLSTVVINGRVVGTWKRTIKKSGIIITLNPFIPLSKAEEDSLEKAGEHYGRFMGTPTTLAIT